MSPEGLEEQASLCGSGEPGRLLELHHGNCSGKGARRELEAVERVTLDEREGRTTVRKEITTDYPPGSVQEVRQHDGSVLRLRKLSADYDSSSRISAMSYVQSRYAHGEIETGLLYVEADATDLHESLGTTTVPLNQLTEKELCPGSAALEKFNASLR